MSEDFTQRGHEREESGRGRGAHKSFAKDESIPDALPMTRLLNGMWAPVIAAPVGDAWWYTFIEQTLPAVAHSLAVWKTGKFSEEGKEESVRVGLLKRILRRDVVFERLANWCATVYRGRS